MPRRALFIALILALLLSTVFGFLTWRRTMDQALFLLPQTASAARLETLTPQMIVAPGLVEPVSKELKIGFDISGILNKIQVREGERVKKGQPLALLQQDEQLAALQTARANHMVAAADYAKHTTGARQEELERAHAALRRSELWHEQATKERQRRERMVNDKAVGIEELERARRDAAIASYAYEEAQQEYELTKDMFRQEDIDIAKHRLEAAAAEVNRAEAALDKTILRSPLDGRILRLYMEPGEACSIFAPSPVLSVGDVSVLNVRAEVDERDISRVRTGQKAYVSADAFGERRFTGRVSRLELSMTPKRVRGGDPSEPVDRSVLEVLITLDADAVSGGLISGLRVDTFIETGPPAEARAPNFRAPLD